MATIQGIYIALFGRPADPVGLAFFNQATQNGQDLTAIGNLAATPEYQDRFTGMSNSEVVTSIFQSLFDRNPDQAGLLFFVTALNNGSLNINNVAIAILDGAQGTDLDIVNNKLIAANAFTAAVDQPDEIAAYVGNDAAEAGRVFLEGVTADAASIPSGAQVDAAIAAIVTNGGAVTLTEGIDNVSGTVFNAPRGFTPGGTDQVNTLNDDDTLNGTGDNAVLNFDFVNDADTGDQNIQANILKVGTINVDFRADGNQTLDLQDSTGQHTLNAFGVDDFVVATFDNISNAAGIAGAGINLSINDSSANNSTVNFLFDPDALSGATDIVNLKFNDVDLDQVVVDDEDGDSEVGAETINLSTVGASNEVEVVVVEDTQTIVITGDQDLSIGKDVEVIGPTGILEATIVQAGFALAAGSLSVVDASAATGDLDIAFGAEVVANQDGKSGVAVDFKFTAGSGDDIIRLNAGLNKGDVFDGGTGDNLAVLFGTATAGVITNVQHLRVEHAIPGTITVDTSILDKLEDVTVRNTAPGTATTVLDKLTAAVAADITVEHGVTGGNGVANNVLTANLADATGAADTVGITITDGVNVDPRFGLTLTANGVENLKFNDIDTESNTVDLQSVASHTGTLTVTGGAAGQFFNLDAGLNNGLAGIYQKDVSGQANDGDDIVDGANFGATADRLIFKSIDASGFAGDFIARVGQLDQSIKTGSGSDTIIFDAQADARAGLTIADSWAAGAGFDTVAIDGEFVGVINIGASEWQGLTGVDRVVLADNDSGTYRLTLTNQLVDQTDGGKNIAIVNDPDGKNNGATDAPSAVVIDARTLSSDNSFSYDGGEVTATGGTSSTDRFIFSDANINGSSVVDGGDDNVGRVQNTDIVEIRNGAVVTEGDLAGISNVGLILFNNDTAVVQQLDLQLTDKVLDQFDTSQVATAAAPENFTINANDGSFVPAAGSLLILDASSVSGAFNLAVSGDQTFATNDKIVTGGGNDVITTFGGADIINAGAGNDAINGGAGGDTMTGGAGLDVFTIGAGQSVTNAAGAGGDVITDFLTTVDSLNFANFGAGDIAFENDGSALNFAAMVAAASAQMVAGFNDVSIFFNGNNSGNAFVFQDTSGNGVWTAGVDDLVILTGVNLATEIAPIDIV